MRGIATLALLSAVLAVSACGGATDTGTTGQPGKVWRLNTVDNLPFNGGDITLTLSPNGKKITGHGPCNSFSADILNQHYPAVRVVNVVSTELACPLLAKESDFLAVLASTTGQVTGDEILVFSSTSGRRLEFLPAGI